MTHSAHNFRVALSVTNCICYDQRVLKMAESISSLGCEVTIIGREKGKCCRYDRVPFKTKRFKMLFSKGFLFYKFFNARLFIYLIFHHYDIIVANDLDTLLPNYLVSRIKHLKLIYDSHEYFTGVPELSDRPLVRWIWSLIERNIFPQLDHVFTVSESIADIYELQYKIRPLVVRNCARNSETIIPYDRKEFGIDKDNLILILQGAGINIDRGGEELIEAVRQTENVTLFIIGSGDVLKMLKAKVNDADLGQRVKFISKVPWEEMIRFTKMADAGISLDKNTSLNYSFSLPNKLFDYISAGIPVIAGKLEEVSKIVETYDCGLIITEIIPSEISRAIITLRDNAELRNRLKQNAANASLTLNWENEKKKVIVLYQSVIAQMLK
jgi:glycosyltransferase involved in cell wall biosynthesis